MCGFSLFIFQLQLFAQQGARAEHHIYVQHAIKIKWEETPKISKINFNVLGTTPCTILENQCNATPQKSQHEKCYHTFEFQT